MPTNIAAIEGLRELREQTRGDQRIRVAVLDGAVDTAHPCFSGAHLQVLPTGFSAAADGGAMSAHGTHVASMIFGQAGSGVPGIAPASRGFLAAIYSDQSHTSQTDLASAINQAVESGAHIINVSGGELSNSGRAEPMLESAVRNCQEHGVLLVAAAGNDACRCLHVPAAMPSVLAVGATDELGIPLDSSNWGDVYRTQGVLAPGKDMPGAGSAGGTALKTGTSFATPVVSGVAALLLSLQASRGARPDPMAVREAILASAVPCDETVFGNCQRFMVGRLNISGAYALLFKPRRTAMSQLQTAENTASVAASSPPDPVPAAGVAAQEAVELAPACAIHASAEDDAARQPQGQPAAMDNGAAKVVDKDAMIRKIMPVTRRAPRPAGVTRSDVNASCGCNGTGSKAFVYAIGTLGYDFGTEANRDGFKLLMPSLLPTGEPFVGGVTPQTNYPPYPPNPYDARQIVNYLQGYPAPLPQHPYQGGYPRIPAPPPPPPAPPPPGPPPPYYPAHLSEAAQLIWTLNIDLTPVYAIHPMGGFTAEVYQTLVETLAGQVLAPDDPNCISRMSLAGVLSGKSVQLFSGQVVPVVIPQLRGMYQWSDNALIGIVLVEMGIDPTTPAGTDIQFGLQMFMDKVYYELRNLGQTSAERALNYSGANLFQAATVFVEQAKNGWQLDAIVVSRSPFCRIDSDCWDVNMKFMNPANLLYARKVYSYTVDVSVEFPVLVGNIRTYYSTT